jgi:hypothetical protein
MSSVFWGSPRHKELLQIVRNGGSLSVEEVQRKYLEKDPKYRATVATTLRRLIMMAGRGEIRRIDDDTFSR